MTSLAYKLGSNDATTRLGLRERIEAAYPAKLEQAGIKPRDLAVNAAQFIALHTNAANMLSDKVKQEGAAMAASKPRKIKAPAGPSIASRVSNTLRTRYSEPYHSAVHGANVAAGYPGGGRFEL